MKAIHLTAYGNPAQNLRMVEVSEPDAPSGGEALVRMEYAPIDYSDLLLANGVYFLNPKLPSVIGGEGAGIVEAIRPGVTSVKVGDRVTIPFGTFTWSEKVLAPAEGLFVVPPSIDARTASMLNINPTTAVLLLDQFVTLNAKDWIALNAANSHVARCLIAIAKSRDLKVVGIVRRSSDSDDGQRALIRGPSRQLRVAEWFADSCAAGRSHWQEVKHPRLLDVLRRVSPQNASGADSGSESSRFRQIDFASHHNIQTIPNQRSNRTLPAWGQGSIGFQPPKLVPCPTAYRPY